MNGSEEEVGGPRSSLGCFGRHRSSIERGVSGPGEGTVRKEVWVNQGVVWKEM